MADNAPPGSKKIGGKGKGKLYLMIGLGLGALAFVFIILKGKGGGSSAGNAASTTAAYPPGYYPGVVPGQGSASDSGAGQALMQLSDQYAQMQQQVGDIGSGVRQTNVGIGALGKADQTIIGNQQSLRSGMGTLHQGLIDIHQDQIVASPVLAAGEARDARLKTGDFKAEQANFGPALPGVGALGPQQGFSSTGLIGFASPGPVTPIN